VSRLGKWELIVEWILEVGDRVEVSVVWVYTRVRVAVVNFQRSLGGTCSTGSADLQVLMKLVIRVEGAEYPLQFGSSVVRVPNHALNGFWARCIVREGPKHVYLGTKVVGLVGGEGDGGA
jgi:hypothetical protein